LNHKYKKLKQTRRTIERRKGNILKRLQLGRNPIPRKRIKRLHYTTPAVDVDATGDIVIGSAAVGPSETLIGAGSATVRTFTHTGISGLKRTREKVEETKETEKENTETQGGSHGR
jgi:hypothetical protein